MTRSEKRAFLTNFIVLQETGKHENSDHCMKNFLFHFLDLHGISYHLIYNLLSKVHSFLNYGRQRLYTTVFKYNFKCIFLKLFISEVPIFELS